MRNDCIIDKKPIKLPNSHLTGFCKKIGNVGDLVVWNNDGDRRLCRIAGRIHSAPAVAGTQAISNWVFAVVLNPTLTDTWIRWIPPEEIEECYDCDSGRDKRDVGNYADRIRLIIANFLSREMISPDPFKTASNLGQ
jgi:hypothetical protein